MQSLLNADYSNITTVTGDPATMMANIRGRLLQPRKKLSVSFNGVELIPVTVAAGTVDAANGPHPKNCSIKLLTNTTFLITYSVQADYWENRQDDGTNKAGGALLYNRWTDSQDIDECNFSKRTRDGKYVIRSDNTQGLQADQLRSQLAVLGVPKGFVRESAKYTVALDGLGISYNIVDREVFKMPPEKAFKAEGEYIERSIAGGIGRIGTARVKLWGDKSTPQHDLLKLAFVICQKKLRIAASAQEGVYFGVLKNTEMTINMYENHVMVKMTRIYNASHNKLLEAAMNFEMLTKTPASDPADTPPMPLYYDRGSAGLLLQAAAYNDPSLDRTLNKGTGQMQGGGLTRLVPGEEGTGRTGARGPYGRNLPTHSQG